MLGVGTYSNKQCHLTVVSQPQENVIPLNQPCRFYSAISRRKIKVIWQKSLCIRLVRIWRTVCTCHSTTTSDTHPSADVDVKARFTPPPSLWATESSRASAPSNKRIFAFYKKSERTIACSGLRQSKRTRNSFVHMTILVLLCAFVLW